jgi:hypothetical protein
MHGKQLWHCNPGWHLRNTARLTRCNFLGACDCRSVTRTDYQPGLLQRAGPPCRGSRLQDSGNPLQAAAGATHDFNTQTACTFKVGVLPASNGGCTVPFHQGHSVAHYQCDAGLRHCTGCWRQWHRLQSLLWQCFEDCTTWFHLVSKINPTWMKNHNILLCTPTAACCGCLLLLCYAGTQQRAVAGSQQQARWLPSDPHSFVQHHTRRSSASSKPIRGVCCWS